MTTPLVLLHGWGVRPTIWDGLRARLDGYAVSCPTLAPSLGASASLDEWADALAGTLPESCVLGAWSLGAMLAIRLAARHPRRVSGLVLFAPTPRFVATPDWRHGLDEATVQAFREAFQRDPRRTQQRFLALQALGDAQRHAVTPVLQAALADIDAERASLAQGLRLLATCDVRRQLPAASLPCLILHGEQDALVPIGAGRWLAEGWSGSRIVSWPECGHAPFLSRPDDAAAELARFLAARAGGK